MKKSHLNRGIMCVLAGISEIVFSILGKTGVITDHKIIVLCMFSLFVFQSCSEGVPGCIMYEPQFFRGKEI